MIRITGLFMLERFAKQRKRVVAPLDKSFGKPCPAAFVLNLRGSTILRLINEGLFLYE